MPVEWAVPHLAFDQAFNCKALLKEQKEPAASSATSLLSCVLTESGNGRKLFKP